MKSWIMYEDRTELLLLAEKAERGAQLIAEFEPKPWRRTLEQNDMIDNYRQFAAYARRIVAHME